MLFVSIVTLFAGIVGSSYVLRKDDSQLELLMKRVQECISRGKAHQLHLGLCAWLFLYFTLQCGLLISIEFIVVGWLGVHILRTSINVQQSQEETLSLVLSNPQVVMQQMTMPAWIRQPSVTRAEWLDTIVAGLWPHVGVAAAQSVTLALDRILFDCKPHFLSKLSCFCDFGPVPPNISAIQTHLNTEGETVLDFHISWMSHPTIRVKAAASPFLVVEAEVSNLQLKGVLRLVLGPHVKVWPCFEAMSVSFVDAPSVAFSLHAASVSLDIIPGFGIWLDSFIRRLLSDTMLFPNKILIPITASGASSREPLGTLRLTVHSADKLHRKWGLEPSSYITVALGDKEHKTRTVTSSCPTFEKEFKFTVYDRQCQVQLRAMATSKIGVVTNSLKISKDDAMGGATFYFSKVAEQLEQLSDGVLGSSVIEFHNIVEKLVLESGTDTGASITFSVQFHKFDDQVDATSCKSFQPTAEDLLSTTGTTNRADGSCAMLFIHVERCNGLRNAELVGKSDPYVVLRVGKHSARTQVVKGTIDPVFGDDLEVEVGNTATDYLECLVYDKNNFAADKLLAELPKPIFISEVLNNNNGKIRHSWSLEPQGSITMELRVIS